MIDLALSLGFALTGAGLTAACCLLHKRISFLETHVLNLAQAGLHMSNSIKLLAETQNETLRLIKISVDKHNESSTT